LLCDQIEMLGLSPWYEITQHEIRSIGTGSEFILKGLRLGLQELKSLEALRGSVPKRQMADGDALLP